MLASNEVVENYESISYPVIAAPKIDAWRSYNYAGQPRTRKGLVVPNIHTRALLSRPEFEGLDGELVCGSSIDPNSMQKAQSAFATIGGEPDFTWHIFDDLARGRNGYWESWKTRLPESRIDSLPSFISLVPQRLITSAHDLDTFVQEMLAAGYEGVITRAPNSPYKNNRSTRKQEWMLKVKPVTYEEGVVIGFNEKKHNYNQATRDDLGYTKRSGHKENKIGADTLGSFQVQAPGYVNSFGVGCGSLDAVNKQHIWDNRTANMRRTITFKHFAQTGIVAKPRHAQFVAFRAPEDMG